MATRRHHVPAALLALFALALPGCSLYGFSCTVFGSLLVTKQPLLDACALFSGDCCHDDDGDGTGDCDPVSFLGVEFAPCDRFETSLCGCTTIFESLTGMTLVPRATTPTYDVPPFDFGLSTDFAGISAVQLLEFDVVPDSLQTFQGAVTYAGGFGFEGFTALGPADTQIGIYGVDVDGNGSVDFAMALRASGTDGAYADVNGDGHESAVDPTITHVADVPAAGDHTFNLLLPFGGDTIPRSKRGLRAFRAHVALYSGILVNPPAAGSYDVSATFTSIDPDSGDADDGLGTAPTTAVPLPQSVVIAPSPLELVDHFLCYTTKPSKGDICAGSAAANAGELCVSDADCGGTAGACVKNKLPKGVQVALSNDFTQFTAGDVDVKKPIRLCTPADKNGEGVADAITHLRGYKVKNAKGTPVPVPPRHRRVVNQLGTFGVEIKKLDWLFVPAAKDLGGPADALGINAVDRYSCYTVKPLKRRCAEDPPRTCKKDADCDVEGPCLGKFPTGLEVEVAAQFVSGTKRLSVVKPTHLCVPTIADGTPIQSPDGHLACYKVKPAEGEPKHAKVVGLVHTTSQLGRDRLDTAAEDELCVPSLALPPP